MAAPPPDAPRPDAPARVMVQPKCPFGSLTEWVWKGCVPSPPAQIGPSCIAHVLNDLGEALYRIAFAKARYADLPFERFTTQYLIDTVFETRSALPVGRWGWFETCKKVGLVDYRSYTAPGLRGEKMWVRDAGDIFSPPPGDRKYFLVEEGHYLVNDSPSLLPRVIKALENGGPVYGDFWVYENYGKPNDPVKHSEREPHEGYKPTKEIKAQWKSRKLKERESHAVILTGTGWFIRDGGSIPRRHFVYRSSFGTKFGDGGYGRIFADGLASAWVAEVPAEQIYVGAGTGPSSSGTKP